MLEQLGALSDTLSGLNVTGQDAIKRNDTVSHIRDVAQKIMNNMIKEGTEQVKDITKRLVIVTKDLEKDKDHIEKTTKNIGRALDVVNAVVSVVKIVAK